MRILSFATYNYKYSTIRRLEGISLKDRFVYDEDGKFLYNDIVIMKKNRVICTATHEDVEKAHIYDKLTDNELDAVNKIFKAVSKGMVIE